MILVCVQGKVFLTGLKKLSESEFIQSTTNQSGLIVADVLILGVGALGEC